MMENTQIKEGEAKASHSRAPWFIKDGEIISRHADGESIVGRVYGAKDFPCADQLDDNDFDVFEAECAANGDLVAAAPELLDALRSVLAAYLDGQDDWCCCFRDSDGTLMEDRMNPCPACKGRAALAKAEGSAAQ